MSVPAMSYVWQASQLIQMIQWSFCQQLP